MFKAFTVPYNDLPDDVNRDALNTGGEVVERYEDCVIANVESDDYMYEDYLVVQMDGKTIFCKPTSDLEDEHRAILELMELTYYLGVLDGIKHEQGYMGGRSLKDLDEVTP